MLPGAIYCTGGKVTEQIIDGEAVLAALDRVKAWPELVRSPQLVRFLDYIVRRSLEGQAQTIKAYSIAVDVFGRPVDFDPQSDPIVRVQARRLRGLLEQYYASAGSQDEVRIVLPVGRYVPDFIHSAVAPLSDASAVSPPAEAEDAHVAHVPISRRWRGQVTMSWFVLLIIAMGAGALAYSLSTWSPRQEQQTVRQGLVLPTLKIVDFQNLTDDSSITTVVQGLAVTLIERLQQLGYVDVSYAGGVGVTTDPTANSFAFSGLVRRDANLPDGLQYNVILTERGTGNVVWNRSVSFPAAEARAAGTMERFAIDIMGVLGNPRGPLHANARQFLSQSDVTGIESPYLCRQLFTLYRETQSIGASERARSCYMALPEDSRRSGSSLAALASLIGESAERDGVPSAERMERYREANVLITEALQAAPTSSFVWEQRGRLHEALDSHEQAEASFSTALQINPSNIDALAAQARHMAFVGKLNDAVPLASRALATYSIIPDWYYGVPTLVAIRDGNYAAARRSAAIYSRADRQMGPILALLVASRSGDTAEVARQLPSILEVPGFRHMGIITQLRRRVTDGVLLENIREALLAAGVPQSSLTSPF
jgi:tetratricopeptide (TPR) repeat protein